MGLIKSANTPSTAQVFSMKDIERHAQMLLVRARQQADQLLAAAQKEAQELRKQAQVEGLMEGKAEGLAKGREEGHKAGKDQALAEQKASLTSAIAALNKSTLGLEQSRRELEAAGLKDVIRLAIAIAERITKRQGELDARVSAANVAEAMKLVIHASDVRIAIHPAHRAALAEVMPRLQLQFPSLKHVEIITDPAITPGGCKIFTAGGEIDAQLETQLQRLVADLLPENQEDLRA